MAGHGPAPKDPSRRARTNKDSVAVRILPRLIAEQPTLPTIYRIDEDGNRRRFNWPARTRQWWQMWADSPLSVDFTSTDWSELLDTALLHAEFWNGDKKVAGELRLRVGKFGATPEDRVRLRIQFAQAEEAEQKVAQRGSSRDRFVGMQIGDETA